MILPSARGSDTAGEGERILKIEPSRLVQRENVLACTVVIAGTTFYAQIMPRF